MLLRVTAVCFAFSVAGVIYAASPVSDLTGERLARVYVNLKLAEQMITTGIVGSRESVAVAARERSADALVKDCLVSVDKCAKALTTSPTSRRAEAFAYLKNAALRLTRDREESHSGHVGWADLHRAQASKAIREQLRVIQDALDDK